MAHVSIRTHYSLEELKTDKEKLKKFTHEVFDLMDKDKNGTISKQEFHQFFKGISTVLGEEVPTKEYMTMAFNYLDADKNKVLDFNEIKNVLLEITGIITGNLKGKVPP